MWTHTLSIRIGGVPYGVGAPLLTGLSTQPGVDLTLEVPSRLIKELRRGRFDAALVSSIEAFRFPGYRAVADLGICSRGPVKSVRAFLRCAPEDVRSVGLDDGSESSVALLKILLQRRLNASDCRYERIRPNSHPDTLPHDLVMLIGDHGLRAQTTERQVLDLGELWQNWTGLPFVYALWLLAPGADAERILPCLKAAHARGAALGQQDSTGGAVHYEMTHEELRGLERFRIEAKALGLADPSLQPEFISEAAQGLES